MAVGDQVVYIENQATAYYCVKTAELAGNKANLSRHDPPYPAPAFDYTNVTHGTGGGKWCTYDEFIAAYPLGYGGSPHLSPCG